MKLDCLAALGDSLAAAHNLEQGTFNVPWEACPAGQNADITVNCFRFAGQLKAQPIALAQEVVEILRQHKEVEKVECVKAFVNISLTAEALHKSSVADIPALLADATVDPSQRRSILIEYSAPNTNKPQHLGHVRNNTLGMATVSLLSRAGHKVIPVNLINNRGIHICKSMLAYKRCGNGITPEQAGIKGDHYVGNFYVKFNQLLSEELKALKEARPELAEKDNDELFLETEIGREAQEMLRKWEAGDEETVKLWEMMNSWVYAGFDQTYERMGVHFDKTYLESNTYLLGKSTVMENLEKGVFQKREDGAVIADLGKTGQKVLLRKDGTSVYITQDIGTTLLKHEEHKPDSMIWVVGDEQNLHFRMLFEILKQMGCTWADKLYHLSYGMVNLPSGRMKSREGTVVDADDLFDEMHNLAKTATLERLGEGEAAPADLEERSETIGMGALKFMLLKFNPKTTILFDPNASLKFEGDTGPYVQYVCARINSIERKAADRGLTLDRNNVNWALLSSPSEREIAVTALRYQSIIRTASEKFDCSVLVSYLLDMAKAFNRFYRESPVLNADSDDIRMARLALCCAVRDILTDGLKTLTIGIPAAM